MLKQLNKLSTPISTFLLIVLVVESIAIVIMQGFVIHYHTVLFSHCQFTLVTLGIAQSDLVSHGIYVITPIYQTFLYIDVVTQRNVCQLLTFLLFGFLVVIFTTVQTIQHITFEKAGCTFAANTTTTTNQSTNTNTNSNSLVTISNSTTYYRDGVDDMISNMKPFDYTMLVIVALCFLILVGGTFKLYRSWKTTHHPHETQQLRYTVMAWAILTGFMKIDLFFLFTYAAQLVPLSATTTVVGTIPVFESILMCGGCLLVFLLATFAIRREDAKILVAFSLVLICLVGYFGFRLFTFGISRDVKEDPFKLTRYDLMFTTLTLALLMIMTLCTCIVCIRNRVYYHQKINTSSCSTEDREESSSSGSC